MIDKEEPWTRNVWCLLLYSWQKPSTWLRQNAQADDTVDAMILGRPDKAIILSEPLF